MTATFNAICHINYVPGDIP